MSVDSRGSFGTARMKALNMELGREALTLCFLVFLPSDMLDVRNLQNVSNHKIRSDT